MQGHFGSGQLDQSNFTSIVRGNSSQKLNVHSNSTSSQSSVNKNPDRGFNKPNQPSYMTTDNTGSFLMQQDNFIKFGGKQNHTFQNSTFQEMTSQNSSQLKLVEQLSQKIKALHLHLDQQRMSNSSSEQVSSNQLSNLISKDDIQSLDYEFQPYFSCDTTTMTQQMAALEFEKSSLLKQINPLLRQRVKSQESTKQISENTQYANSSGQAKNTISKDCSMILDIQSQLEQTKRIFDRETSKQKKFQAHERLQKLEDANKHLQDLLYRLQQDYEQVSSENDYLKNNYKETRKQLQQALKLPQKLKSDYIMLNKEYTAVLAESQESQIKLTEQLQIADKGKNQLQEMENQLTQMQSQIQLKENQAQAYSEQIQLVYKTQVESLKSQLEVANNKLNEQNSTVENLEHNLLTNTNISNMLSQKNKELQQKFDKLESQTLKIKNDSYSIEQRLEKEVSKLNEQLTELRVNEETSALFHRKQLEQQQQQLQILNEEKQILHSQINLIAENLDLIMKEAFVSTRNCDGDALNQIQEQIGQLGLHITHITNDKYKIITDLASAEKKVNLLQTQCAEFEMNEQLLTSKCSKLAMEQESLRNMLVQTENERKQSFQREDRALQINSSLKFQFEVAKKEVEKGQNQIKFFAENGTNLEIVLKEKQQTIVDLETQKTVLEIERQRLQDQLEQILACLNKIISTLNGDIIKQVFTDIVKSLQVGIKVDLTIAHTESDLQKKETELMQWASQDNTALNDNVCQIRLSIEKLRQKLKGLVNERDALVNDRERALAQLKSRESMERRRCDVSLDVEQSLAKSYEENVRLKFQLKFEQQNKEELKVEIEGARQQSFVMQREITSLRQQIKEIAFQEENRCKPKLTTHSETQNLDIPKENFNFIKSNNATVTGDYSMLQSPKNFDNPQLLSTGVQSTNSTQRLTVPKHQRAASAFTVSNERNTQFERKQIFFDKNKTMPRQMIQESSDDEQLNNLHSFMQGENQNELGTSSVQIKINHLQNVFQQMRRNLL